MPAYVIACVKDAWDHDKLAEYRERNTDAVAKHGGRFVARGGRAGDPRGRLRAQRVVIMEFPDLDAARGLVRVRRLRAPARAAQERVGHRHRGRRGGLTPAGGLGAAQAAHRPPGEQHDERGDDRVGERDRAGVPEMKSRPVSISGVNGLTVATACTQPESRSSGTYTGARNSTRNTGICISGPAWIVRSRIATPAANSVAASETR